MPSVLVELDFICNPESAKYMSSEKGVKQLANAIFNAVEQYRKSWEKSVNGISSRSDGETYTPGEDDGVLTDTYSITRSQEIAVVSSRKKKVSVPKDFKNYNDYRRKRRSSLAKTHSEENSYERDDMALGSKSFRGVVMASDADMSEEPMTLLAADSSSKDAKKNKKKKEKEKKTKQKVTKEEKKRQREDGHNAKLSKLVTVYKIQLLASADLLNQNNARFCGLSPISTYKENNLYKYYYGESTDRSELEAMLPEVKKKIPDAFIVSSTKSVQTNKK